MIELLRSSVIPAALSVLPVEMRSPEAARLILAIGQQESGYRTRVQVGGPARGWWQFELAGIAGVMGHPRSRPYLQPAITALGYRYTPTPFGFTQIIEHNDFVACVFARLLLWTLAGPIPTTETASWTAYVAAWRPGKPRVDDWATSWAVSA